MKISQLSGMLNSSPTYTTPLLTGSWVTGQINRHKNQRDVNEANRPRPAWKSARGAPYGRARGRAGRAMPPVRRSRTLILHNSTPSFIDNEASASDAIGSPSKGEQANGEKQEQPPPHSASTWIAKQDRHRQIIHPAIYERERLARMRDLEMTRRAKVAQEDERQKAKIQKHLQEQATPMNKSTSIHEIMIQGLPFRVTNDGSRLLRISGENDRRQPAQAEDLMEVGWGGGSIGT